MTNVQPDLTDGEARALFIAAKLIADSDEMDDWTYTDRQRLQRALRKLELLLLPETALILSEIDKATGRKVAGTDPWPGLPVTQVPVFVAPVVANLIKCGLIEEVSRPSATDPTRVATFYRRVVK